MRRAAVVSLAAALWMAGCDGPSADVDGGMEPDASWPDAGTDAGTMPGDDAGPSSGCEEECADGEACVRGVCIADCGGDVSGFDAALGDGLTPIANVCRPASAVATQREGGALRVWDLTAATEGTVTTFTVSRWTLDAAAAPEPTVFATAAHDTESAEVLVFPSAYLAPDSEGSRAVFGYTTSAADLAGGIFFADAEEVRRVSAPGNFDVAWVDEDAFVVNGVALDALEEGQGLYAATPTGPAHVGTRLGAYSGSVVVGPAYILAAGLAEDFSPRAYLLTRERFEQALADAAPVDFEGELSPVLDPSGEPLGSSFSQVGERLVVTPFGGPLTSYALTVADGEATLSDERVLATGSHFTTALDGGEGHLLLVHAGGLLLVRE